MLSYALKRITRSWKLFAALALGMTLAATFFGGINVGADTVGKQALDAQLANTPVDMTLRPGYSFGGPGGGNSIANSTMFANVVSSVKTVDGVVNVESIGNAYQAFNSSAPNIRGIQDNSIIYNHAILVAGKKSLSVNETLLNADSQAAQSYHIGQLVSYSLGSYNSYPLRPRYNITLLIVGTVSLDTNAANSLGLGFGGFYFPGRLGGPVPVQLKQQSIFLVSWERTFTPMVNWEYNQYLQGRYDYSVSSYVNVYLDRNRFISAFGIEGSISQIQQVEARVSSIAQEHGFTSYDQVVNQLQGFSQSIFFLRLTFTAVSIPVFFLAWYVGRTVSHSSFNLRRKEIGLLLTRGFTRSQLFRQFLTEGLMVGLIAGIAGLVLADALNPVFIQALGGGAGGIVLLTNDTIIITLVFTVFLTLFSILSPARQAAAMDPAQALKGYVYLEETRPARKRGPIVAFILGLYQLVLLALGLNYMNLGRYIVGLNFFLAIILFLAAVLSFALTFIGPFLFLYGAAQLSTGLAQRFHRRFASLARKVIGDVAALASRSVFRNPRRVAALVFIVALIVGYSIWVIGDLASQQDYNYRQAQVTVGSDIRLSGINTIANATLIANQLHGWSNITGSTPEADFTQTLAVGSLEIKAIDPLTWRQGAYYESDWLTGNLDGIFSSMASDNQTMVLDHGVASYNSIPLGTRLHFSPTVSVSVIALFGPDYSQTTGPFFGSFQPEGWSFIPLGLVRQNPSLFSPTNLVLARAAPGVNLTQIGQSLERVYPSLSVSTAQVARQGVTGVINAGTQNVLRLGTAFAGLAASIGVGTVAYTGYREREKEITMVAVRGLSYRQLAGLLITEFLPLVVYALILATVVGLIVVWGDAQSQNSLNQGYLAILAARRVIFPLWASVNILGIVALLLAGVFVPAALAARKDLSKMSRTVRFA